MAIQQHKKHFHFAFTAAIVCMIFTGCQTMNLMPSSNAEITPPAPGKVVGQYQVQMMPRFGKATVQKIDITAPITVQDALVAVNAPEKFRAMKITLSRVIKDKGQLLKFPIGYDVRSRSVPPAQNYQVLPGDTLSISADSSNSVDKMIQALTGGIN